MSVLGEERQEQQAVSPLEKTTPMYAESCRLVGINGGRYRTRNILLGQQKNTSSGTADLFGMVTQTGSK